MTSYCVKPPSPSAFINLHNMTCGSKNKNRDDLCRPFWPSQLRSISLSKGYELQSSEIARISNDYIDIIKKVHAFLS